MTQAPKIQVAQTNYVQSSNAASLVEYQMAVSNPNSEPLPLNEFHYTISIDGKPVFSTVRAAQATVRRLGTQSVDLPAVIPADVLPVPPSGVHDVSITGELTYTAPGQLAELMLDTGARIPSLEFHDSRKVDFSKPGTESSGSTSNPQSSTH